jgi:hypothetical protein
MVRNWPLATVVGLFFMHRIEVSNMNGFRGFLYTLAKLLGDVNAVQKGNDSY